MLNKQLYGALFERVEHIEGRQRDETDFFRNLQWLLRINLIPTRLCHMIFQVYSQEKARFCFLSLIKAYFRYLP